MKRGPQKCSRNHSYTETRLKYTYLVKVGIVIWSVGDSFESPPIDLRYFMRERRRVRKAWQFDRSAGKEEKALCAIVDRKKHDNLRGREGKAHLSHEACIASVSKMTRNYVRFKLKLV